MIHFSEETVEMRSRGIHFCVAVSSAERAGALFGDLFGMKVTKTFTVGDDLVQALFGRGGELEVVVYDAVSVGVEVFIDPDLQPRSGQLDHLCLGVRDLESLLMRAGGMGMDIHRFHKGDKEVIVLRDLDGNLYELKEMI